MKKTNKKNIIAGFEKLKREMAFEKVNEVFHGTCQGLLLQYVSGRV